MALTLYNTLTRRKEPFTPLDPNNVRMYVCGPTVYDYAHIGNARPIIVFDVLFRLLRHLAAKGEWDGGKGKTRVTYVRNITDVDDKINARAAEEGIPIRELTERTAKQFHADIKALGVLEPTHEPRATEHIDEMKALIEALVAKGHAYVAEDHVLFHVPSMPDYGRLSNRSVEEMQAGARVEVAPYKRDPQDFVLWKPSKPGEPAWPSPSGIAVEGRPGWHIECSAMADKWLWEAAKGALSKAGKAKPHQFDIHGGGIDLVFPHHENEIAQSRCGFGADAMAQVWMHNGFLQVEGEKMAKSTGNFVTIRELLNGWQGYAWPEEVVRLAMLMTHYRQPIDFSHKMLEQAAISLADFASGSFFDAEISPSEEFLDALNDDLNTPRAITELHRLFKMSREETFDVSERMAQPGAMLAESDHLAARQLAACLHLLGISVDEYDQNWMQKQAETSITPEIRIKAIALLDARSAARRAKNFKEADRIREELAAMGIALKDSKDPETGEITTTWEIAR